jgi:hypothetical protein
MATKESYICTFIFHDVVARAHQKAANVEEKVIFYIFTLVDGVIGGRN